MSADSAGGSLADLPSLRELRGRLARVRLRWRAVDLSAGLLLLLSVLLGLLLILGLAEMLTRPGPAWRVGLLAGAGAGWVTLAWLWLARPLRERITDERAAVKIESAYPALQNLLINAIQLSGARDLPMPGFAEAAIDQAAERVRDMDVGRAVPVTPVKRGTLALLAVVLAAGLVVGLKGEAFGAALRQMILPLAFVPAVGEYEIARLEPGDCSVLSGGELNVEVQIRDYDGRPPEATLLIREEGASSEQSQRLEMSERTHFLGHLSGIRKPLQYRVEVGGTQSRRYTVTIVERPKVEKIFVQVHPPEYTGYHAMPFRETPGDFQAPEGSTADVRILADRPVKDGTLVLDGNDPKPLQVLEGGTELRGSFEVKHSGYYIVRLRDADDHASAEDVPHKIECIPDRPPAVRLVKPEDRETTVPFGQTVVVRVEASDDYGLREVSIRFKRNREGLEQVLKTWTGIPPHQPAHQNVGLELTQERGFEAGDTVILFAEAKDHHQSARSDSKTIKIADPKDVKQEKTEVLGNVLLRLETVLRWQNEALALTDQHLALALKQKKPLPSDQVQRVFDKQVQIRDESASVTKSIPAKDPLLGWVRDALAELLSKPMPQAILEAERVKGAAARPAELAPPLNGLAGEQRKIVAGLKSILSVLDKVAEHLKDEVDEKKGKQLPNDVKKDLAKLDEKMKEFLEQQKKVVKASEDLAKTPVEDLTQDQKKELEALKALEDNWAKFMKEAYTDLSKVPPQDFSDPRLLQEMLQTYEQVEMAKDALSKKATEIAVAVEQSGLENAKELKTNIEKWLPDTPDRQAWKMEEPIGDGQTPLADLPKELEDIVGDLMEKEEELMEEADDATSKWADSMDKGAGWDAMDGPISNMSAKGVTGNMLPNTQELGGRAGEGRQAKSSGQMVGDTAEGKGGRKTPTRLTPDPFEAGRINDKSKDPAGGSTGGGKEGGAGGEGLEGPVPPGTKDKMERLAGKQAEIRNQAERLALNLKVMNYPSADLEKAVKEMRAFETELKDGRYANIARQRPVLLKNLQSSRSYVEGVARIGRDGAPSLPRSIQDEVLDALSGEHAPKGYEDLLKSYYDSLFKGDGKTAPERRKQ